MQHFYGYLELSALNLWLVTEYYAKRGYLEVEDPRQNPSQTDRKKVYSVNPSPWDIMDRERLLKECRTRNLGDESLSDEDLRGLLSDATWCGFRMTKCLRAESEKKKRPGSEAQLALVPAKKKN
jgi:hypothetical protein